MSSMVTLSVHRMLASRSFESSSTDSSSGKWKEIPSGGQSCLLLVGQGDDEVLAGIAAALEEGHGRSGEHIYRGMEGLSGRETRGHRAARESVEQKSGRDERGLVVAPNDDGAVLVMGAR